MTEMKPNKVREEQLTGLTGRDVQPVDTQPLTVKNAHRAAMIRKKGSTAPPASFHFRKKHHGMANFVHLLGSPEEGKELRPAEFKDWEVTEFKHPGYLEDLWEQACDAYRWSSFDPDIRGESDIIIYEKELHDDLKTMPGEKHEGYITAYKQRFAAQLAALSRCAIRRQFFPFPQTVSESYVRIMAGRMPTLEPLDDAYYEYNFFTKSLS